MDIGRTIAASLATVALGLSSACAADDTGGDPPEPSAQASAAAPVDLKRCVQRQRYHTWPARDRLQSITAGVLAEPDRVRPEAIRRFARNITKALEETSKPCGDQATALHALAELVRPMTATGVDEQLLRQVVDAFEEWGTAIGRPGETRIIYAADPCVPLREDVQVSYEVRRVPDDEGTTVWVDIVVVNDGDAEVYVDHGGSIEATGVRPDGATRTYQWGGSSADTAGARPGRTSRTRVAPVPATGPEPSPILLLPDGEVRVHDVTGSAYATIGPCRIEIEAADESTR